MATFLLTRTTPLTPAACWDRVTDWARHGDRIPFTHLSVTTGSGRTVGDVVLARTQAARLRFDDPMEIVAWVPPAEGRHGLCRLEKRGRAVRGWAELRVGAADPASGRTRVMWVEELRVRGLPAALDPAVVFAARRVFGRALDDLLGTTAGGRA